MQFDMGSGFIYSPENGSIAYGNRDIITIRGIRQGILTLLVEKNGTFVSREEIIKAVWGKDDISIFNASLTQQIYLLRKDLNKAGLGSQIISNQNEGYKLIIDKIVGQNSPQNTNELPYHKNIYHVLKIALFLIIIFNVFISLYSFLHIINN